MKNLSDAQRAAISARKKEYYETVVKPRIAELRRARIEGQTPRLILPKLPSKPRERLELRAIRFEERTKPLPAHPPIRTTWLMVKPWEMAA